MTKILLYLSLVICFVTVFSNKISNLVRFYEVKLMTLNSKCNLTLLVTPLYEFV